MEQLIHEPLSALKIINDFVGSGRPATQGGGDSSFSFGISMVRRRG
jgi:hypothetical protein